MHSLINHPPMYMYMVSVCFRNCTECSPEEFKDSHMVLQMDLLDSKEQHDELCLKVLEHYGRV